MFVDWAIRECAYGRVSVGRQLGHTEQPRAVILSGPHKEPVG